MDKVIFTVCGGGKYMTKATQTFFNWAIHLKPQNLSYLNICLVEVVVFVCLCDCVLVCLSVFV